MRMEDLLKSVPEAENAYNVMQSLQQNSQGGAMSRGGRRDRRTVDETKTLIKEFIFKQGRPCLILEICAELDRKPSPHFRAILADMVNAEELIKSADRGPSAVMDRFWYSLP